ncbi:MAG: hypothetical protein WA667_22860 [Candidatus Nitrosopolaris sp.]
MPYHNKYRTRHCGNNELNALEKSYYPKLVNGRIMASAEKLVEDHPH